MADTKPLVTVVIPTYSRPTNLLRAISSVLNQTYKEIEIIVVDDNGIDTSCQKDTRKVLQDLIQESRITYIPHDVNKNGSAARNTGLEQAKGAYICFLDDDDIYESTKIEKQVQLLESMPQYVGGCLCSCKNIAKDYHGKVIEYNCYNRMVGNLQEEILMPNNRVYFGTSKWMMRTSVCRELGGFDTSFRRNQDLEFLIRFFRKYIIATVDPETTLMTYDMTDHGANHVKPETLYNVKTHLFEVYKDDIDKLNGADIIYKDTWLDIARYALNKMNYSIFTKSYRNACKGGRVSFFEKIKMVPLLVKFIIKRLIILIPCIGRKHTCSL